jgi:hypothetical protein
MGIGIHPFNFLRYALKKSGSFGKTATIGRQNLDPSTNQYINKISNLAEIVDYGEFCEKLLLTHFGSVKVDSYDYSDYQGATFTYDLNMPPPSNLTGPEYLYDTIIDSGSLEHIFNIPQAFKNISNMCKIGGTILHALPANNFCGHGFWQMSPELFFSLYSEANGYTETEVFLAGAKDIKNWYKVKNPKNGIRRLLTNSSKVLALVKTKKIQNISHYTVQQSDYVHIWKDSKSESNINSFTMKANNFLKNYPAVRPFALSLYDLLQFFKNSENLSSKNIHLTKNTVKKWID